MAETEGVRLKGFHEYGHFCMGDMGSVRFPELLTEVLQKR